MAASVASLTVAGLALFLLFLLDRSGLSRADEDYHKYGVVVDAGSSGSRVWVYKWKPRTSTASVPNFQMVYKQKKRGPVDRMVDDAEGLTAYLTELVNMAENVVPEEQVSDTPLYFMATAGMRMLLEERANTMMSQIDVNLSNRELNPFRYHHQNTRILSGEEEGAFAWLTVNYLHGYFQSPSQHHTAGVLEMGGASTQVAFIPEGILLANKYPLQIADIDYNLYVHSYLYYGQERSKRAAKEILVRRYPNSTTIEDPCILKDDPTNHTMRYEGRVIEFKGTGDPDGCQELVDAFVYTVPAWKCHPKPCAIGGVYQPTVGDGHQIYAIGAFYYPAKAFELVTDRTGGIVSPAQLREGARDYCQKEFESARSISGERDPFVSGNCLMGLYSASLLTKAYGFSEDSQQITIADSVNGQEISWTLGALLYEISREELPCLLPSAVIGSASSFLYHPQGGHIVISLALSLSASFSLSGRL